MSTIDSNRATRALTLLAIGVLKSVEAIQEGKSLPMTMLIQELQQGWEQLCYLHFSVGEMPPLTVTRLIHSLHVPISEWGALGRVFGSLGYSEPLLAAGQPSSFCVNTALPYLDKHLIQLELDDAYFRVLHEACMRTGIPESYASVRTFLIRNPVVHDPIEQIHTNMAWDVDIRKALMGCFERVPSSARKTLDGQVHVLLCPHCGWPLRWQKGEARCHESGICHELVGDLSTSDQWLPYTNDMACTKPGIQRYVVAPELSLIAMYEKLAKGWGLQCTLFPHFDAYDLLITFPNGRRWAVDLKDHRSPVLLALNLPPFRRFPTWDRAFYVFPDYRADPSYLQQFETFWTKEPSVQFMGQSAFINGVQKELMR